MPKSLFNEENNESLLDKGLKIIIRAFNEQKNEYSQNIFSLQSEIKKLKEENSIYKNKLSSLQQKLNSLSKTVLLLDEDVEESKNEEEKKVMMETLNNEFHLINKNLINKNKNNIGISRNNRTSLGKNITNLKKKFKTNAFNSNEEINKINNMKTINNNHKRIYSNNYKNLKYTIKHPEKPIYIKTNNYLRNNNKNSLGENMQNNLEISDNDDPLEKIDLKDMEITGENDSKLYKKLNLFIEECKRELNALDYENVLELLKSFETDSDFSIKKKIKKIISDKNKLIKLFDAIFES